ncbi:threonine ammonia-lyase [Ranunculus cassubicifolius]
MQQAFAPSHVPLHHHHHSSTRLNSSTHLFFSTGKNKISTSPIQIKATVQISHDSSSSSVAAAAVETPPLLSTPPLLKVRTDSLQYPSGELGAVPEKSSGLRSNGRGLSPIGYSYLKNILSSKVYDVAIESPLEYATKVSERNGAHIWLKREDMQPVFSFKLRGAYNMMAKLTREQLDLGVICSSAGNHAQGVALAARELKCDAVIVMPVTTPEIKWKSVERLGAKVVLHGDSYDEAQAEAKYRSKSEGRTFVPPFDHPDIIAGQGTVGAEILRQTQGFDEPIHAVFVPVGGGGLIAGIAAYLKEIQPKIKIIGVEPADANAMALSFHHGQRVELEQVGGFADGVAVKVVGEETFRLCREFVDGIVLVSKDAICASIKDMFEETRSILEPAGALALAGAEAYCKFYDLKGKNINVVAITSGANMNFDRLRLITELADIGRKREAVLSTYIPEEPGSFRLFAQLVGSKMNITEFKYRYDEREEKAEVVYSVGVHTVSDLTTMVNRMELSGFETIDHTSDDLFKEHLRHLIGGRSKVENERLFRFVFPERPGALMKFLDSLSPKWNISLFHYRSQGETGANVLVGVQVHDSELGEFHGRAALLGYTYTDETSNTSRYLQKL